MRMRFKYVDSDDWREFEELFPQATLWLLAKSGSGEHTWLTDAQYPLNAYDTQRLAELDKQFGKLVRQPVDEGGE